MKKFTVARLLVVLFALTLLAAGCSSKKAVEDEMSTEQPTQEAVVEEQQPAAVQEQVVDEAAARAAAERAAAQAATSRAMRDLSRIHFDFDQYVLTPAAKDQLRINANLLKAAPGVKVQVEGHCDERGSEEYNLALGERRALATKNYLVSLGVAADRMSVISYGEEMPLDPASNERAWAKNRRAEFKAKR